MELFEAIKTRRSVRSFKRKKIPDEVLTKILEAAIWAPSSGNLQNWEFIVVKNKDTKEKIAEIAYNQDFIAEADVVLVVCSNQNKMWRYGERGEKLYSIQNVAAAIQNILLTAHSFGIGSCWIGAFDERELASSLDLPDHVKPHAIIPLGYANEKPRIPSRVGLEEVTFSEKYGKKYTF
jgi:nitroreductase